MSEVEVEVEPFDSSSEQKVNKDQTPPTEAKSSPSVPTLIDVSDKGALLPKTHEEVWRIASMLIKGGGVPRWYVKPIQVVSAWNLAASLGLPPQPSLKNIAVIEGTPSLFGDLPKALVDRSGLCEKFDAYVIDKDYKKISIENKNLGEPIFAAICFIKRKGHDTTNEYFFTVEEAKKANLWEKKSSKGNPTAWVLHTKTMMLRRVIGMAIKFEFPDLITGASIAEYDYGKAPDIEEVDVTPEVETDNQVTSLNQKYKSEGLNEGEANGVQQTQVQ